MTKNALPKSSSVKVNFIMNAILRVSAFIFPLITFPYVSRILGASGNGKITFATSVVNYFSMFAQLGIPTYGIRTCAACRDNPQKLNKTVQELLILNSITVVLSYIAFSICIMLVPKFQEERGLLIITSATILLGAIGMEWLFQALEQYSYITIRNLAFKVVSIILMFVFVHKPKDYIVYGAINVIGTCGSNIFNVIYASKFLDRRPIGNYNLKQHIKPILNFFMLTVSISVYTSMDSVMLGFMASDTEVGYYAAATKMKTIVVSTVTALGAVLLPRMSNFIAQGKLDDFYRMIKKSFSFIFVVATPVALFCMVASKSMILFLAGAGYTSAIVPMQIISWTIIFIGLSNITGMQVLVPTNREKYTTLSTAYGALVNLIVNALAIPRLGASGAAIGTVIAEFTVLVVQIYYLRTELLQMLKGIQYSKIFIALIFALMAVLTVEKIVSINGYFLNLCITGMVYFGIYFVFLVLLREKFVCQYYIQYKDKIVQKLKKVR